MLNNQGFDLWANEYDRTVQVSEENNLYPFAGYKNILNVIFNEAMQKQQSKVLDIGFGTGILTSKLYENGHQIDGLDFSKKMIGLAQEKMPMANLMEWDISNGLPDYVKEKKYDSIISTYTLHHLTDEDKVILVKSLLPLLADNGKIIIGDIAFQTRKKLEICRNTSIQYWDNDEFYFVFEEINASLKNICTCEYHSESHCGGVLIISK
ncbi:class I SAM-dependent methyltransferase [Paenisporosarcina antarctica]|uniref:Class I SAM-dependent methyltransferase n=1 Tax=Paenisporosarcina antarctica TaxID=417367 RepID=A0A4P6ZV36_9BACL|nr:class I SAM-dependent methyltransferase [Paenisporosarcina antarctica]QBP40201.1 class I SAM-dependent methyltransferase [Paenisporosarcina antarctica]